MLILLPPVLALGAHYAIKWRVKSKKRRTPLTEKLLRSPGDSLRLQIDDLTEEITFFVSIGAAVPLFIYSVHLSQSYFLEVPEGQLRIMISMLFGVAFCAYFVTRLAKLFNLRRRLRLGYDAELAVGQEISRLMLDGCHVYHDFPAGRFNIDHIVVGPAGVFAVETKGRSKPTSGNGRSDAEVVYDGKSLRFPGRVETKALDQASDNARWLRKWLSSALGEPIGVQPVVVLPGWFVKRVGPNGIPVLNPKLFPSFFANSKPLKP